ncbi:TonB-dependent receptor [Alishewanella sp. BS5-314]|uniref:TonB-dependent receptor n=1 Tax=Alishewanella sp. BS5-314 TaxID=2755587 RepID=UPI0021BB284B|nr:TonB-dependent receptor [Alishewanella sp. BS5-314]MCT8125074.1 TonB-dependent receptor [Alishewanella sp. BS5-314]
MRLPLNKITSAIILAFSLPAAAQTNSTEQTENTTENSQIEQIVVTGKASGMSGLRVDQSYAITSVSAENITKLAPKSTAELFTVVPGVWSESSGGVAGANVFVRGFPSTGDAPFLSIQLNGAVIYPPSTLSFLENSSIFRLDETIHFMEALRGGANPVISHGQPGLTTNFVLKEGSDQTEGLVKYSTSNYGQQRIDAVLSGKLADRLYFMAGGYINQSEGPRETGFTSEKGHQFTINLTKELDNGSINFYTRQTDDHGVWHLPVPLNIDGIDNTFTQIGPLNRQATIAYGASGETASFDFGDGRGWNGGISGGSVDLDLTDSWRLVYRFSHINGQANTFGLVPEGGAVRLGDIRGANEVVTGAATGNSYSDDTFVQQIGRWVVLKDINAFTNDLALSQRTDNAVYTLGLYQTRYSVKDWWSIGNQAWHVLQKGGERLSGLACNDLQDSCSWNYDIDATGDGTTRALYAAVEYQLTEQLRLDAGARRENHQVAYTVDEGLTGRVSKAVDYDESKTAWTVGANYMWQPNMGVFARVNQGNKMPHFDDFRDNFDAFTAGDKLIKEVTQYELGYKWAERNHSLYLTGFYNEVEGELFVTRPGAPAEVLTTEALGIEIDANYIADNGFMLNLNATIQDTEITNHPDPLVVGNQAIRQPKWQLRLTPSYGFEVADMFATLYGTVSSVSDRYGDNGNTVTLAGYTKLDLGLQLEVTDNLTAQLAVANLTDKAGITEGDPRNPASPNGRYIMPRTIDFSVSYRF